MHLMFMQVEYILIKLTSNSYSQAYMERNKGDLCSKVMKQLCSFKIVV